MYFRFSNIFFIYFQWIAPWEAFTTKHLVHVSCVQSAFITTKNVRLTASRVLWVKRLKTQGQNTSHNATVSIKDSLWNQLFNWFSMFGSSLDMRYVITISKFLNQAVLYFAGDYFMINIIALIKINIHVCIHFFNSCVPSWTVCGGCDQCV